MRSVFAFTECIYLGETVAEWVAPGSGELSVPSSSPAVTWRVFCNRRVTEDNPYAVHQPHFRRREHRGTLGDSTQKMLSASPRAGADQKHPPKKNSLQEQ